MPLPFILDIPENGWDTYWFNHYQDHLEIISGMKSKKSISLTPYPIYPWSQEDIDGIMERHQQMHDDMNAAVGTPGTDIGTLDTREDPKELREWVWRNYSDHANVRQQLGI